MEIFSLRIVELAVCSTLLSLFLDFCFREGNIFEGWLDFLADLHLPKEAMNIDDREDRFKLVDWFWFKPLGGCVVCMNVWISFITCALFFWDWRFIIVVLLSNFLVRFFQEKIV